MCNNLNLPHFFEVIGKSKFHFVKLLVWDKVQVICGKYYMGQVDHIFMLRKGKDKPINDCGKTDLLSIALQRDKDQHGNNIHDSQKPTMLFQVLVAMSSDTTAIACIKERRHFIGFELNETYYKRSIARIKNEQAQLQLPFDMVK